MLGRCPGSSCLRTPTLSIKKCPACGENVEIFSTDTKVACGKCGFIIYNNIDSCIRWCKYARECFGEEMYRRFAEEKDE